jgi:ferredoxin
MDKEMAELVEQYLQETQGSVIFHTAPAVHRVIPVEEAVPVDIEVYPYERASELIDNAKAWGVRDCLCRVQRRLVGEPCDHPVENCLLFAPVEGAFAADEATRAITREEALRILREAREAGLVHTTGNYQDRRTYYGRTYICNCCTCSCGILRSVAEFGVRTAVAHSDFRAHVDEELCIGCGTCLDRCQFGALSVPDDVCLVNRDRCMGCGLCVSVCRVDALSLHRLPAEETLPLPATRDEWMAQRAEARGIEIEAVL